MGCPHGDTVGACPKCARAADAKLPPAPKGKTRDKLRVTNHRGLLACKFCGEAARFKVVRAWTHKTQLACLECGKEQNVHMVFAEEDDGDRKRTTLVPNAAPRAKYQYSQ